MNIRMNLINPSFASWCASQGIITPLEIKVKQPQIGTGRSTSSYNAYRYTVFNEDYRTARKRRKRQSEQEEQEFNGAAGDSTSTSTSDTIVENILQCPLHACLIGTSNEDVAERLSYEKDLEELSSYAPYLGVLPDLESLQSLPRFWSSDRLDIATQGDGGWLAQTVQQDTPRIQGASSDPWALAIVDSRANVLPDRTVSLTPVLDMINHNPRIATTARVANPQTDGASLHLNIVVPSPGTVQKLTTQQTTGDVGDTSRNSNNPFGGFFNNLFNNQSIENQNGGVDGIDNEDDDDEVYISYGPLTNIQTLLNYGFVRRDNPYNTESFLVLIMKHPPVVVTIQPKSSSSNAGDTGSDGSSTDVMFDPISVGTLRKYLATTDEIESLAQEDRYGPILPYVSKRNELETYGLLAGYLEEAIEVCDEGRIAAERVGDVLVSNYLQARRTTLQQGYNRIRTKFPELF